MSRRRRRGHRRRPRRTRQTWANLVVAALLLAGILAFWSQLATGAAACFSGVAPPPEATEEPATESTDHTPRRQIRIKRVPGGP